MAVLDCRGMETVPRKLQAYLRHELRYAAGLWVAFFMVETVANVIVVWYDVGRLADPYPTWAILVWESSSALATLATIPLILSFDRYFPMRRGRFAWSVPAHLLFTVPWSLAHVLLMVGIRKVVYWSIGRSYEFGPWASQLLYEFLKDFRTYFGLLAIIYLYRFIIRRLQGEASLLREGEEGTAPDIPDRFLVKKLDREFLVRVRDIDWIEATGNYVTLHVGERRYLLRATMSSMERRLQEVGFARVHRSAIVNLDRVREIRPFDTGDARAELHSGATVPVSRRYRQDLRHRLA